MAVCPKWKTWRSPNTEKKQCTSELSFSIRLVGVRLSSFFPYWAKFGSERKAPNKDKEVADGLKATFSIICPEPRELLELKNQFTMFFTSTAFGNVNVPIDRGTQANN
jgi:hypothetical protein